MTATGPCAPCFAEQEAVAAWVAASPLVKLRWQTTVEEQSKGISQSQAEEGGFEHHRAGKSCPCSRAAVELEDGIVAIIDRGKVAEDDSELVQELVLAG